MTMNFSQGLLISRLKTSPDSAPPNLIVAKLALERSAQRELVGGGRRFRERRDSPPEIDAESGGDSSDNEHEI